MPKELLNMHSATLTALTRERTVFLFSVGPMEDHGPHLPLGLDLLEASRIASDVGARIEAELPGWTAVIMPPVPLSVDGNTTHICLAQRSYVLRDYLVDSCRGLHRLGFCFFACVSGHSSPRQLTAIEEASKVLNRRVPFFRSLNRVHLFSLNSAGVSWQEAMRAPFEPNPSEHGGKADTSLALAIVPDKVSSQFALLTPVARNASLVSNCIERYRRLTPGYWGRPSEASEAEGQRLLADKIGKVAALLVDALKRPGFKVFRSPYSVLPPNWSYFKAWFIFILLLLLMSVWVYWFASLLTIA